jgi:hypothetical protein
MADPYEVDAATQAEINGLNSATYESDHGPAIDGFLSMLDQQPKYELTALIGGDLHIEEGEGPHPFMVRPVAAYGRCVIAEDLRGPQASSRYTPYLLLRGYVYVSEVQLMEFGKDQIGIAMDDIVHAGRAFTGILENGLNVAYNPISICRDGMLAYTKAHTLEELGSRESRKRTAEKPIAGSVVTVLDKINHPLTLLVEGGFQLTDPVLQAHRRIGSDFIRILSYTNPIE